MARKVGSVSKTSSSTSSSLSINALIFDGSDPLSHFAELDNSDPLSKIANEDVRKNRASYTSYYMITWKKDTISFS